MRILIVTDAWAPQVNGVVTTVRNTVRELELLRHEVGLITPDGFRTMPCPTYPEIRLALGAGPRVRRMIEVRTRRRPHRDRGAVGSRGAPGTLALGYPFTTAYHTQFPEFIHARCRLPLGISYRAMRWFHDPAEAVMVPTPEMRRRLEKRGFTNLVHWSRGVDTGIFKPAPHLPLPSRPIFLYAGRVAVEKHPDFLKLDLPGTKWVVGDGPARARLEASFPKAVFHGMKHGADLAYYYQQADAFVFPSLTDTFGLVLIEAMACGTPVAAYPASGPIDVIRDAAAGILSEDLRDGALQALLFVSTARPCIAYSLQYSWAAATAQFVSNLIPRSSRWPRETLLPSLAPANDQTA